MAASGSLKTQLEDASKEDPNGLRSNCYQLRLNFDIKPAPTSTGMLQTVPRGLARLWRHVGGWLGDGQGHPS